MLTREHYLAIREGLIVLISGLSLWILAIILRAYALQDVLPWTSWGGFFTSGRAFITHWQSAPLRAVPEVFATIGFLLIVLGPLVDWLLLPWLERNEPNTHILGSARNRGRVERLREWLDNRFR